MTPPTCDPANTRPAPRSRWRRLSIVLPVVVLVACAIIAVGVMQSHPTAKRAEPTARQARLVTVTPAEAAPSTLMLAANGTVEASDSTQLRARVSGQIVALTHKLAPGTRFHKGDVLARLDDTDYRLALAKAKTQMTGAQAALRVERGQQAVAKRELALVGASVSDDERDLALRGPQLEQAKGDVATARNAVDQAELDLERTTVRAPFTGIVTSRDASIGDVVTTSDTLATLAATKAYWVDVSVPVDELRWLHAANTGGAGSPARVFYPDAWGDDVFKPAEVLRVQASLETSGRMARVLLRVPDPLGGGHNLQLLLGAYVQTKLQADIPGGSVVVDSAFVHENNQVWVMNNNDTLDIRSVDVVYRDARQAIVAQGLQPDDQIITTELTAPIQGMPVRVETGTVKPKAADTTRATPSDTPRQAHGQPDLRLAAWPAPQALARTGDHSEPGS